MTLKNAALLALIGTILMTALLAWTFVLNVLNAIRDFAWALRDPVVTGAIVGMSSAEQAKQIVRSAEFRLTPDEILEIEEYLKANPAAA